LVAPACVGNWFSEKVENHVAAIARHSMYMNVARPQRCLANPFPRTRPSPLASRTTSGRRRRLQRSSTDTLSLEWPTSPVSCRNQGPPLTR
jgi:hypothetical protein